MNGSVPTSCCKSEVPAEMCEIVSHQNTGNYTQYVYQEVSIFIFVPMCKVDSSYLITSGLCEHGDRSFPISISSCCRVFCSAWGH